MGENRDRTGKDVRTERRTLNFEHLEKVLGTGEKGQAKVGI